MLFLDELPEFQRTALEAMREPLETGQVTISRAARQAQFPARFQLIAAMNPCPCGWLGAFAATGKTCRCPPDAISRYQGRLSGPLLDRIDMQLEVPAVKPADLLAQADGESSATVAQRVAQAHQRQLQRQGCSNSQLSAAQVDALCLPEPAADKFLRSAAERLGWSGRGLHRVLRLARTVADLAGSDTLGVTHVAEAIQYRRGVLQS